VAKKEEKDKNEEKNDRGKKNDQKDKNDQKKQEGKKDKKKQEEKNDQENKNVPEENSDQEKEKVKEDSEDKKAEKGQSDKKDQKEKEGQKVSEEEDEDEEEKEEKEMSFLDHLEELRWHLIRSLSSIMIFAIIAFVSKKIIFHGVILAPSRPDFWTYRMMCKLGMLVNSDVLCIEELPFIIQSRQMTGQFTMHIISSLVIGLIFAFPYTFWEMWRFISPGLYEKEKNVSKGAVFYVTMLFLMGISFGYFIVAPISIITFSFSWSHYQLDPSIQNEFDIISYVSTVTMLVLACGIMFQMPIIAYFLTKAGLVTPKFLRTYRKHAIIVILAVSAIITPPDVVSQILIALPLMVLYQVSIMISRNVLRNDPDYLMLEEDL